MGFSTDMESSSPEFLPGETEYRQLGEHEVTICRKACAPGGTTVQDIGKAVLQPLYKQGLIYLSVPISPADHISIPPLEVRGLQEYFRIKSRMCGSINLSNSLCMFLNQHWKGRTIEFIGLYAGARSCEEDYPQLESNRSYSIAWTLIRQLSLAD